MIDNTFTHFFSTIQEAYFNQRTNRYLSMLPTIQVPIISSVHGRKRRLEREITKEELQAAVKYGKKEATYTNGILRWKYSFADIVYISDETSSVEVTCYTVEKPMGRVVISERLAVQYDEANLRITKRPKIITSHTVLIVDMSGSMRKSDMNGHKTRARGVYYTIAEDFIASRLHPAELGSLGGGEVTYTDVVTLIEMRSTATVVFECEPISWQLYNRFIDLHDSNRARDHGIYFESFRCAFDILRKQHHDSRCALCLLFFSDGAPSDRISRKQAAQDRFPQNLHRLITDECALYKGRLTFSAFGFGQSPSDFNVIRQMIDQGRIAGAKTSFGTSSIDPAAFSLLLSTTVTSLTETRNILSQLCVTGNDRADEKVSAERERFSKSMLGCNAHDWTIFTPAVASDITRVGLRTTRRDKASWTPLPFSDPSAVGFAVSKRYFGEGAERIVSKMAEVNAHGEPVGPALVAKESLHRIWKRDAQHQERWHKNFIKTQCTASKLAVKFNQKLDMLGVDAKIFRIQFLECSIYNARVGDECFSFFAEKQLDPRRYVKFNNNSGGVSGVPQMNMADFETSLPALLRTPAKLAAINEEAEEDDDIDQDECGNIGEEVVVRPLDLQPNSLTQQRQSKVFESDIPQTFSHWTYRQSNKHLMVCDLQGQPNINGFFEFTDPSIHYPSNKRKFGRTDHGDAGINNFFKTHQCNHLCRILSIANDSYTG